MTMISDISKQLKAVKVINAITQLALIPTVVGVNMIVSIAMLKAYWNSEVYGMHKIPA